MKLFSFRTAGRFALTLVLVWATIAPVQAGDLNKNYFGATKPGAWSEYALTSPDGTKATYSYQRGADSDGQPVIEVAVKILAGPGKDSTSKTSYFMPRDFSFERDGLNYGRLMAKMTMTYGGTEMPVDPKTLEMIKQGSKDFHGALTFEAAEKIDGHGCDRYSYAMKIGGPSPTRESGHLWLDPSVPFGMVRQTARVSDPAGKLMSEFEMRLTDTGLNQAIAAASAPPVEVKKAAAPPAAPAEVSLAEGFKAGRVGMDIEVVPGSSGRRLRVTLVNKTDAKLTVNLPAGAMDLEVSSPVDMLRIAAAKAAQIVVPAGGKAEPTVVEQRGARGLAGGNCSLSIYEGTPIFSGSATIGPLPK